MIKSSWAKMFKNYNEAKMVIIELEYERRAEYEEPYVWDGIIEKMNKLERDDMPESKKIHLLMTTVCRQLLLPPEVFPRSWLMQKIPKLKDMINYYKKNPEETR